MSKLKDVPMEVLVGMPTEMVKSWDDWVDRGLKNIVIGAPDLANPLVRETYVAAVRDMYRVSVQARGEKASVLKVLERSFGRIEGGDEVLALVAETKIRGSL